MRSEVAVSLDRPLCLMPPESSRRRSGGGGGHRLPRWQKWGLMRQRTMKPPPSGVIFAVDNLCIDFVIGSEPCSGARYIYQTGLEFSEQLIFTVRIDGAFRRDKKQEEK